MSNGPGTTSNPQRGHLYGLLTGLKQTLYNFWYMPSIREYNEKTRTFLADYKGQREQLRRQFEVGDEIYKRRIEEAKKQKQSVSKLGAGQKALRTDYEVRRDTMAVAARQQYEQHQKLLTTEKRHLASQAFATIGSFVPYLGQALAIGSLLSQGYKLYVDAKTVGQMQTAYNQAQQLPKPEEAYTMPPQQLNEAMKRVESLEKQMQQILPVLYEISKKLEKNEKPIEEVKSEQPPEAPSQPETKKEKPPEEQSPSATTPTAVAVISAISLGLLALTRNTTMFASRVAEVKAPLVIGLLAIMLLSLFTLIRIRRK